MCDAYIRRDTMEPGIQNRSRYNSHSRRQGSKRVPEMLSMTTVTTRRRMQTLFDFLVGQEHITGKRDGRRLGKIGKNTQATPAPGDWFNVDGWDLVPSK